MNDLVTSVPVIQVRPNCIIEYIEYFGSYRGKCHRELTQEDKESGYTGQMTDEASKRIKRAINLLIMSTPAQWIYNPITQKQQLFQLAFITLTVSSTHTFLTAKEAHTRLLSHFLQWMRRTKKCKSYIWKAELQRRGQIHYHITLNTFINHNEIRDKWNELQRREGLLDEYYEEHKHYNPNSIDVHSVIQIENLAGYMCKYMAKGTERDPVMLVDCAKDLPSREEEVWGNILSCYPANTIYEARTIGKTWDCSDNLSGKKYFNTVMTPEHQWTLDKATELKVIKTVEGASYKIRMLRGNNPLELLNSSELQRYNDHMKSIREHEVIETDN